MLDFKPGILGVAGRCTLPWKRNAGEKYDAFNWKCLTLAGGSAGVTEGGL